MKFLKLILFCSFIICASTLSNFNKSKYNENLIETRIVGGKPAKPHQFPYQVGLSIRKLSKTSWCGGVIISKDYILTAAHCFQGAIQATAFIGAHRQGSLFETDQVVVHLGPWNLIQHENYNDNHLVNDIGLIKLSQPITFNENIQPVNLPLTNIDSEGLDVIATGWGRLNDENPSNSITLQYVNLKLISLEQCSKTFGKTIRSEHLCGDGTQKKSTCRGDSGGPIVTKIDGIKTVIGIVSFGGDKCEKGYPSVFTRIYSYLDWIKKHTGIQT